MIDKTTCWYNSDSIQEMNKFFDMYRGNEEVLKHLITFSKLLSDTELEKNAKLLDLGCGTAMLSAYCEGFKYYGADLSHVIENSAMKFFPQYFYKHCELYEDDLSWISEFDVVVMNGVLDVMDNPIDILEKVLKNATGYVIIHRQEITENGQTSVHKNGSYGGQTYHSIINKTDFEDVCDRNNFNIYKNLNLYYTNWENNGNSLLLKRRKTWSINEIDVKLYQNFFKKENGRFLEAGANDGVTQSNTFYLEFYKNWTGILVEPIKEVYDKLIENRSSRNTYFNAALVGEEYGNDEIDMVYTPENKGMLSVVNDENAETLLKRAANEEKINVVVKAMTLNQVLSESIGEGGHLDLMILDIEGYETKALKNVNFEKYFIDYILVEELQESDEITNILKPYYERIDKITEQDYLYKRK